ncbi:DNA-binding protein HU [Serinicoccus hydrothermalis]|uniref:DNA-binding protein HU n=1 Tax=Serinicoccus hydrothermalis TaxID=1758689 RepID=A0A1B1NGU1_9MICO|nr:DNA-binding protein HU [Serinicoccus hydrothermalis]
MDIVLREVAAGGSVGISGFGTFEQVERAPRTGRNPRTGESVPIAGTRTPRFRPGSTFKEVVGDPSTLPARGLAGARAATEGEGGSTGTPSTVRRSGGSGRTGAQASEKRSASDRDRERRAPTGTPSSVRRQKSEEAPAPDDAASDTTSSGGRVFSGGEDITAGMISAKKAQLARVKNDEVVKGGKKKGKGKKNKAKKKKKDG